MTTYIYRRVVCTDSVKKQIYYRGKAAPPTVGAAARGEDAQLE
jgi:hypothetical protein